MNLNCCVLFQCLLLRFFPIAVTIHGNRGESDPIHGDKAWEGRAQETGAAESKAASWEYVTPAQQGMHTNLCPGRKCCYCMWLQSAPSPPPN